MTRKRHRHSKIADRASPRSDEDPHLEYLFDEQAFYRDAMPKLPEGQSKYLVITGADESSVSSKVSKALEQGYKLYGSPSVAFNGETIVIAQALVWPDWREPTYDDEIPF